MKVKKIIIIGNTASSLYLFRKDFIISCINERYKVICLVSEYDDEWINKIKSLGADTVTYELSRGELSPLKDIKSLFYIKYIIKKYKADIVFSFFSKPVIYGSLAAKLAKTPKIVGMIEGLGSPFTEHPNGQNFKMKLVRFFQILLYRVVFPFLDKIIFLNKDDPIDLIDNKEPILYIKEV